jgi:hypothetical protein
MRKLSLENRWRQSPHHGGPARGADHSQRNGAVGGGVSESGRGGEGGRTFPRIAASELTSTLSRQLSQLREVCSRRWTELAERFAPHRATWARMRGVIYFFPTFLHTTQLSTLLPVWEFFVTIEEVRQDFLRQNNIVKKNTSKILYYIFFALLNPTVN